MAKSYSDFASLQKAIQKEMHNAFEVAVDKSFDDLQKNVEHFYDAPGNPKPGNPPPGYDRTGQLKASPQLDGIDMYGNDAVAQLSINTGTQYDPAGRDTETIYGYAEEGGLRGNGGFWKQTEIDIENNINESFGKRFSR